MFSFLPLDTFYSTFKKNQSEADISSIHTHTVTSLKYLEQLKYLEYLYPFLSSLELSEHVLWTTRVTYVPVLILKTVL